MTISVLQVSSNDNSGGASTTCAVTLTLSAGSALHVATLGFGTPTVSVSSSPSLTWLWGGRQRETIQGYTIDQFVASGAASGSITVTATFSTSNTLHGIAIKEIGDTSGFDASCLCAFSSSRYADFFDSGTDNITSGKTNKLSASPALISGFGTNEGNDLLAGTGFTQDGGFSSGYNNLPWPFIGEYKRVTNTSPQEAIFSSSTPSNDICSFCAVFLETGAQPDPQWY
jgi:hypothetical protein